MNRRTLVAVLVLIVFVLIVVRTAGLRAIASETGIRAAISDSAAAAAISGAAARNGGGPLLGMHGGVRVALGVVSGRAAASRESCLLNRLRPAIRWSLDA